MTDRMTGFQKPASQPGAKEVNMAVVHYEGDYAACSCGWSFGHTREKVREDAVDRHLTKRHEGRGLRL